MKISKEKVMIRLTALHMTMDQLVKKSRISKWRLCDILNKGECDNDELNSMLFGKSDDAFNVTLNATILC